MFCKAGPKGQRARIYAGSLIAVVLLFSIVMTVKADALYILTGPDNAALVLDETANGKSFASQIVNVNARSSGSNPEITLSAGHPVSIRYQGADLSVTSQQETVSALLTRVNISPSPLDMVAVDVSENVIRIEVASDLTFYDKITEAESAPTIRRPNPELEKGQEQVVQEGEDGTRTGVYEVIYSSGKMVSRQLVDVQNSTSLPRIVEYGTLVDNVSNSDKLHNVTPDSDGMGGVLTFASGDSLSYAKAIPMTATAYTANVGKVGTRTATGTRARVGVVAVDPKVIPLGSRVYVVTNSGIVYGTAVAEDTGVRGNIIDLYYDTYNQCINFGRRSCTVYVLD